MRFHFHYTLFFMLLTACMPAAQAALVVRHYNSWSTAGGQISFSPSNLVFQGVDPNVIDYWNGNRFDAWRPVAGVSSNYGVEWSGYIRIDEPGQYGFGTISDDGSEVWINGERIVANHELQWYDWEDNISEGDTSGETFPPLVLSAGYHSITIRFYEQYYYAGIEFWWLKPNSGPSDIPYYGTTFHGVAPTFNPNTNWELVPATVLFTEIPQLPGDYNHDGQVDAADYVVWRKSPADFGGDPDGYNTWRENFGRSGGSGGVLFESAVPEPASVVLLLTLTVELLSSSRAR